MTQHFTIEAAPRSNWINGRWNGAGTVGRSISPSTGEVLGSYIDIGPDEAREAIVTARTAFDTTGWSRDRNMRSRALFGLANRMAERQSELALMLSREGAKLLAQTG